MLSNLADDLRGFKEDEPALVWWMEEQSKVIH
jgi:hypothetical protein